MRRAGLLLASLAVGCATSGPNAPSADESPTTKAAAIESPVPVAGPAPQVQTPPPSPPAWTLEPFGEKDRALLARLVDSADDLRKAAVAEWEEARVASESAAQRASGNAWPPGPATPPDDWAEKNDDSTPKDEAAAIRQEFANRTRALARGLIGALREGEVAVRVAAATSMGEMQLWTGRFLTQALADPSPEVRIAAARALSSVTPSEARYPACFEAMVRLLDDADWRVRAVGIDGVRSYRDFDANQGGEGLARAVPRLIALASDEHADVRQQALSALQAIEPWGRDAELRALFLRALGDREVAVRRQALRWFRQRMERPDAKPVEPELVAALRPFMASPDRGERFIAAAAIWRATRETASTVPIFTDVVAHAEGRAPLGALWLLTEIGPEAESATAAVLSVLTLDEEIRHFATGTEAMDALHSIGPRAAFALPLLRPMLADADPKVRAAAARAVEALDGDDDGRERLLARMLAEEQDDQVRAAIHESRAAIGVGGDAVVADLLRGLEGGEYERWSAIAGLRAMGPRAAVAASHLQAIVETGKHDGSHRTAAAALVAVSTPARAVTVLPRVRHLPGAADDAARLLQSLGPADASLVPTLLAQLDDSPAAIARALAEIGPAAKDALPSLERLLRKLERADRVALAEAVQRIGGDAAPALRTLIGFVEVGVARPHEDDDDELGAQAAYSLARCGTAARPAIDALRRALAADGGRLPAAAAFALWRLGDDPDACLDRLVTAASGWSPSPPIEFVESIGAMGPAAARATPTLVRIALAWRTTFWRNTDTPVHATAIRALGLIGAGAAGALPTLREIRRNSIFRAVADEAIRRIEAR